MIKNPPTLVCIGGARSASSWLNRSCHAHPDMGWLQGEPGSLSKVLESEGIAGIERAYAPMADYAVRGEKDPYYSGFTREEAQRTRDLLPDLKIIYLARNPPERAISHIALLRKRFLEKRTDTNYGTLWSTLRLAERPLMARQNDVERTLKIWTSVFPPEQILVLNHDDVRKKSDAALQRVADFAGVNVDGFNSAEARRQTYNSSKSDAFPNYPFLKYYLTRRWAASIRRLQGSPWLDVSDWIAKNDAVLNAAPLSFRLLYPFAVFYLRDLDGGLRRLGSRVKRRLRLMRASRQMGPTQQA